MSGALVRKFMRVRPKKKQRFETSRRPSGTSTTRYRGSKNMSEIQLLDHGYIKLIETWGSDERIVEAARMSTDGAFRGWGPVCKHTGCDFAGHVLKAHLTDQACPGCGTLVQAGDEKLLTYLYNNNHATPFEMAGAVFEVQAPIFVFREWHRHRTQSYNELSARYTPLPDLYYMPSLERVMLNQREAGRNKQAGTAAGADELTEDTAQEFIAATEGLYEHAEAIYQQGLRQGIPKELARVVMPVGHY